MNMKKVLLVLLMMAGASVMVNAATNRGKAKAKAKAKAKVYASVAKTVSASFASFVDLGLPSGTKWADRNVGANAPEDYGTYFSWGETQEKSSYSYDNYEYGQNDNFVNIGSNIAGTKYDAATAKGGVRCQMPTKEQCEELCNPEYTTWTWCDGVKTKYNGSKAKGYMVKSKSNGKSIFLPAAGNRNDTELNNDGYDGAYWTAELDESNDFGAWYLYFHSNNHEVGYFDRFFGHTVRPVSK